MYMFFSENNSKKAKEYICCVAIFLISVSLIIVSLCFGLTSALIPSEKHYLNYNYQVILALFILEIIFIIGVAGFRFLYVRTGDIKCFIIESFCRVAIIPFGASIFGLIIYDFGLVSGLCVFLAGVVSSIGYWLIVLLILFVKGLRIAIVAFAKLLVRFFCNLFNVGKKGKMPIKYYDKIIEVFLQIILLPISAFVEVCAAYFFICGHLLGGLIIQNLFYCAIKKEKIGAGYSYYVEPKDNVVTSTVTHAIRDSSGAVVGSYDTTESHIEHDSGYRYESSDQFKAAYWNSFVALPCRIISLFLSIMALFIPSLYISVMKPKTQYTYNYSAFRYFDILMIN